jgi:3D (Asp-Asp-Asp) domain-containing protein
MYTCVELGGCATTASGIWPEPGMVAVDPAVIPLGSTVWIQGLGTFLAADTGSLVRGAHLDVFGLSYSEALQWGVQERSVIVFTKE